MQLQPVYLIEDYNNYLKFIEFYHDYLTLDMYIG